MNLLQMLGIGMGPNATAAGQQSGLQRLLSPEMMMAMGSGLMGNQGNMNNVGQAMANAVPVMAMQRQVQAQTADKNKTLDYFRQNSPEYAAMIEAGLPIEQAWGQYAKQRFSKADRQGLINAGDGQLYDPNTGQWISAPGSGEPDFRMAEPEEAARYGAQAGQFGPDGRFYPLNPPQGMTIESDGAGGFRMVQGPGAGTKFTEVQSKDNVFSTRARGALPTLDQYEQKLTSLGDRALNVDPTGLARGALQDPDFQVAQTAGDEFLQAILRKDTGAAITEQEQLLYGRTYLPQPGDSPEAIAYKRQARLRAVAAIEAGMTPSQMVAQERALQASGGNAPAGAPGPTSQGGAPAGAPGPVKRFRFNPQTGKVE